MGGGKFPKAIRKSISDEQEIHFEEGIRVDMIFRNYKAPGKRFKNRLMRTTGAICLTDKGLYTSIYSKMTMQLHWDDSRISTLEYKIHDGKLSLILDVEQFNERATGIIEYRMSADNPEKIVAEINKKCDMKESPSKEE
jgi:hypothetical protein